MRLAHHSKCALGLVIGLAMLCACHGGGSVTKRVVTMHVPPGCVSAGQALDGEGYAKFYGYGDFDGTLPVAGHFLSNVGDVLSEIDPASRSLVVDTSEGPGRWLGLSDIPATGNLDVLLLPWMASCPLPSSSGAAGATIAPIGADSLLIVGGIAGDAGVSPASHVVHLDTGSIDSILPDLTTPRTEATVTAFGDGALVAGGLGYPQSGKGVLDTAEVYSPALGGIDQKNPITLSANRADHGAAVLVTGETLLVGGVGQDGATLLSSMEIVDPVTRAVRAENVALLSAARREPVSSVWRPGRSSSPAASTRRAARSRPSNGSRPT
jgi:hypothetical protein